MAAEHVWGSVGSLAVGSGRWSKGGLEGRSMRDLLDESRLWTELGLRPGVGGGGGQAPIVPSQPLIFVGRRSFSTNMFTPKMDAYSGGQRLLCLCG